MASPCSTVAPSRPRMSTGSKVSASLLPAVRPATSKRHISSSLVPAVGADSPTPHPHLPTCPLTHVPPLCNPRRGSASRAAMAAAAVSAAQSGPQLEDDPQQQEREEVELQVRACEAVQLRDGISI